MSWGIRGAPLLLAKATGIVGWGGDIRGWYLVQMDGGVLGWLWWLQVAHRLVFELVNIFPRWMDPQTLSLVMCTEHGRKTLHSYKSSVSVNVAETT